MKKPRNWAASVAEAVRDKWIERVDDPDWHGGERAAQEIAELLHRCATREEVVITEYPLGSASLSWHNGFEPRSLTVLPSTLKRLRDLGLVEPRPERNGLPRWGLSVTGELVSRWEDS